jgi:serpin B
MMLFLPFLGFCAATSGQHDYDIEASSKPRNVNPNAAPNELLQLSNGNSNFAFDLYKQLLTGDGNIFFSPFSVSEALAMTYAGARGDTEKQMAQTLHFTLTQERLHPTFNALDLKLAGRAESLFGQVAQIQLNIANSLWGQRGHSFLKDFLNTIAENYGAGLNLVDFQSDPDGCRIIINDWVEKKTEDRITELIPIGGILAATRLVLVDAIYFNAVWQDDFDEAATKDGAFHLIDGRTVNVPMMHQQTGFNYYKAGNFQLLELPYWGRELSMYIMLPDEGSFAEFEKSLDTETFNNAIISKDIITVQLSMPKYEFSSMFSLKDTLAAMGMPDAFGPADFSGMDGGTGLYIGDVFHKTFVKVNEIGTIAAAATAVRVDKGSFGPPETIEFNIDRPFVFVIRDNPTGTILFAGRVLNPAD